MQAPLDPGEAGYRIVYDLLRDVEVASHRAGHVLGQLPTSSRNLHHRGPGHPGQVGGVAVVLSQHHKSGRWYRLEQRAFRLSDLIDALEVLEVRWAHGSDHSDRRWSESRHLGHA